ncbi:MAG: thioredoxin family protein [candidate division WOR-3 bacterium]|nr:thioredoxin family protein [candidate division WOR-3 bacterium]
MEIKQITIKGNRVGIIGLDEIFQSVRQSQISDENSLKNFLFEKAKERNYIPSGLENDYKDALYREYKRFCGEEVEEEETGLVIKILGPGCPNCEQLERDVRTVVQELNIAVDIEHVRDLKEIAKYGVVATPGLVINKKLVSTGRVPNKNQIRDWILSAVKKIQ